MTKMVFLKTTLHAGMSVEAYLMDVTIWDGTREVDLLKPDGSVLAGGIRHSGFH